MSMPAWASVKQTVRSDQHRNPDDSRSFHGAVLAQQEQHQHEQQAQRAQLQEQQEAQKAQKWGVARSHVVTKDHGARLLGLAAEEKAAIEEKARLIRYT